MTQQFSELPRDVLVYVCGFCEHWEIANAYLAQVIDLACMPQRHQLEYCYWACRFNKLQVVVKMLHDGLRLDSPDEECPYFTDPLLAAVDSPRGKAINLLLDAGAVPTSYTMGQAAIRGHIEVVRAYLDHAPKRKELENTALFHAQYNALYNGHVEVARLLETEGRITFDPMDPDLINLFHKAVQKGYLDVVNFCVDRGFVVFPASDSLYDACNKGGHLRIVNLLLDAGAEPNHAHLLLATQRGYFHIVQRILGLISLPDYSVLMAHAVGAGSAEILGLFLDKQMPLSRLFTRLFHRACRRGHTAIVQVLLDRCKPDNVFVRSARRLAQQFQRAEVVGVLNGYLDTTRV